MKTYTVRGKQVVLDRELAQAFGVETKSIKRIVKRHPELFTGDKFVLELSDEECLRYQIGTSNQDGRGGNRYLPFAFTKEGVQALKTLMKSNVEIDFFEEPQLPAVYEESWNEGTVVMYQPDETLNLEVRVDEETVWLTQEQIALLFKTTRNNITIHINNIFLENELEKSSVCKDSLLTAADGKSYQTMLYNLDVIISVGYRVRSVTGVRFRQWANKILKNYVLRKGSYEERLIALEVNQKQTNRILDEHQKQIDFFVKTSLPPKEQIFMQGQFFDAHQLFSELISSAKQRVIIIDNYVDSSVLALLSKRSKGVKGTIYTSSKCCNNDAFKLDLQKYNSQYPDAIIDVLSMSGVHDRFLIIDDVLYSSGGSFKDAGKKLFSFEKMTLSPDVILQHIK